LRVGCAVPYASAQPAQSCLERFCGRARNETDIHWTAPLVHMSAALESLMPPLH